MSRTGALVGLSTVTNAQRPRMLGAGDGLESQHLRQSRGCQHGSCAGGQQRQHSCRPHSVLGKSPQRSVGMEKQRHTNNNAVITKTAFCGNRWDDLTYKLSINEYCSREDQGDPISSPTWECLSRGQPLSHPGFSEENLWDQRCGYYLTTPRFSELVTTWQLLESRDSLTSHPLCLRQYWVCVCQYL